MAKNAPLKKNIYIYMYIHMHKDPSQFSPLQTHVYLNEFVNGKKSAIEREYIYIHIHEDA